MNKNHPLCFKSLEQCTRGFKAAGISCTRLLAAPTLPNREGSAVSKKEKNTAYSRNRTWDLRVQKRAPPPLSQSLS